MNTLGHRWDGPPGAPVVVLGASLGTTLHLWDAVVDRLARSWRILRFDLPGHGVRPIGPAPLAQDAGGPYTIACLAHRVIALLDESGTGQVGYCGVSLSGAVGQHLAAHHPSRLTSLTLICTAARFATPLTWAQRAARVRAEGTEWLAQTAPQRWLTAGFVQRRPDETNRVLDMLRDCDRHGYAACCDALASFDMRDELRAIAAPTLVIAGADDPATPPEQSRELAAGIRGARLRILPDASHLAVVERPGTVAHLVDCHLRQSTDGPL